MKNSAVSDIMCIILYKLNPNGADLSMMSITLVNDVHHTSCKDDSKQSLFKCYIYCKGEMTMVEI